VAYGHSTLQASNVPLVPSYVAEAAAGAVGALFGLSSDWGRPLLVLLVLLAAWAFFFNGWVPSVRFVALVAGLLTFWTLTALARAQLNDPVASRYLYPACVLIVLAAAEAAPVPLRVSYTRVVVLATLIALAAAVANFNDLRFGSAYLQDWSSYVAAELGALETAGHAAADYAPDPLRAPDIRAGLYFAAVRHFGSPADDPDEIARRPEPQREAADRVLIAALATTLRPGKVLQANGAAPSLEAETGGTPARSGPCVALQGKTGSATLDVSPRGQEVAILATSAPAQVQVRRFADAFAAPIGSVSAHSSALLPLGRQRAPEPWHVRVSSAGDVSVCGARTASST
jgi:hypothetical protein